MSARPRVSVLMPVYDARDYLDGAIQSVLDQGFADLELLLVDDGSDAATRSCIRRWAGSDGRIRVIRNEANLGVTRSLNTGLAAARGELLARQDADDLSLPGRLQAQVAFLDGHPGHVLVGCDCARIDPRGRIRALDSRGWTDWELALISLVRTPIVHSSAMFRMAPVRRLGLAYDERLRCAEDFDLWCRMLPHGRIAALPELLVLYRQHAAAISSRRRSEQRANLRAIALQSCLQRLPELAPDWERVTAFFDLLYLGRAASAHSVVMACDGIEAITAAFARRHGLNAAQRFRARRLCARWLAMGMQRARLWRRPRLLAPLAARGASLFAPLAAELVDYGVRHALGPMRRPPDARFNRRAGP